MEKAASSLKNREAQLSLITGNIQDLVMQVDDQDQIQYLSSSLNKILGFDYQDFLEVHPEEFVKLFNTILINVTAFLRDQPAWDYLSAEIIPQIIKSKKSGDPIRVWSAGCASGEEAYSIAMLLAEALGAEAFRDRVKIYATDVDEEALTQARQAAYTEKQMEPVPPAWRKKYFEQSGTHHIFCNDLRCTVIFGRHDLIVDAPISGLG